MVKFKQYFKKMYEANKSEFDAFKLLSEKYAKDKNMHQSEYNRVGESVVKIIHDWENNLCSAMEKGKNNLYSTRLSEKFWAEIRAHFSLIDLVGIEREL